MQTLESVAIRRAEEGDLAALCRVQVAACAAAHRVPGAALDWRAFWSRPEHFVYLAEHDQPFGFVCAGQPVDEYFEGELVGEVIGLYLLPECWGQGMGRKLLVRGLSVLKRRDFHSAFMWIRDDAERARRVAGSLGFEPLEMSRTTNVSAAGRGAVIREAGYRMSLADYF